MELLEGRYDYNVQTIEIHTFVKNSTFIVWDESCYLDKNK